MPVPKRKRSRSRRDKRFANKGMEVQSFTHCPNCQDPIMTHVACKSCGHYKGKKVFTSKSERTITRTETRKAKQKAAAPEAPVEAAAE